MLGLSDIVCKGIRGAAWFIGVFRQELGELLDRFCRLWEHVGVIDLSGIIVNSRRV